MIRAGLFAAYFLLFSGLCSGQTVTYHYANALKLPPKDPYKLNLLQQPRPVVFMPVQSAAKLPFFSRLEHYQSTSGTGIPVKFRLGSVEYVDWLEGKPLDPTQF